MIKTKISAILIIENGKDFYPSIEGILAQNSDIAYEIIAFLPTEYTEGNSNLWVFENISEKHPSLKLEILEKETKNKDFFQYIQQFSQGDYLAFCQAPDRWISSSKLDNQYKDLNRANQIDLHFHRAYEKSHLTRYTWPRYDQTLIKEGHIDASIIIQRGAKLFSLSSLMIKKPALSQFIRWLNSDYSLGLGDMPLFQTLNILQEFLFLMSAIPKGAIFSEQALSIHNEKFEYQYSDDMNISIKNAEKSIDLLNKLDEFLKGEYKIYFAERINHRKKVVIPSMILKNIINNSIFDAITVEELKRCLSI